MAKGLSVEQICAWRDTAQENIEAIDNNEFGGAVDALIRRPLEVRILTLCEALLDEELLDRQARSS